MLNFFPPLFLASPLVFCCNPGSSNAFAGVEQRARSPKDGAQQTQSLTHAAEAPVLPKPVVASIAELPETFAKSSPASLADLKTIQDHVEEVVAKASPAVVAVEVGFGSGSGVIISADGLVLTAGHVCGRANRDVRFTFSDGKVARGKTVGVDRDSDTGLMRISDRGPWPHVPLGDLEQARLGDWVLALGHPGGFDPKRPLVVRLGRIIRIASDAVQTDCTISPGDSGGPLFDMQGRVIAIHSAISTSMAENFHVPIDEFLQNWDQLAGGKIHEVAKRPAAYLGASVLDGVGGCLLKKIDRNSPASSVGLRPGDLVMKVDGREIKAAASFRRWLEEAEPGEALNLEIKRGEKRFSIKVKLQAERSNN